MYEFSQMPTYPRELSLPAKPSLEIETLTRNRTLGEAPPSIHATEEPGWNMYLRAALSLLQGIRGRS